MCLIITVFMAAVFSVLFAVSKKTCSAENSKAFALQKLSQPLFTTMLSFWAASIMWSVDGIANILGGEPFLDLSKEDALLGVIIALCGLALFAVLALRNIKNKPKQEN